MKRLLYLFVFLIICFSVSASDINILTYRDSYSPLETFQAEIILDEEPLSDLNNLNFEFIGEESLGILLFLEKLSNTHYFVYFNIPDINSGEYKFKIKDVNVLENNVLKRISEEKIVNVVKVNDGFEYLLNNQNENGNFNDIAETSLGALALKNINNEKANLAISYLLNNQDPTGCYSVGNCNVKDTSFALLALSSFNKNYFKTKNWLEDASNNFEFGLWNLRLEGNSVCGNIQLNGVYNLAVNDNEINVNCNNNVDFTLTHTYLGGSYTIYEYTGANFSYVIDDSGCYGLGYKGNCDYISTLYASWALDRINEDFPEQYLDDNKLDNRTIDHALSYILYNDDYDKNWLLNNYLNGYWSYNSASISQEVDYFVSALATYALKDEFLFEEAKDYLKDKTEINVLNSALILYLLFEDERDFPSITISPGIVNKKNIFNLNIKNNKDPVTIFIEAPNFTNLPSELYLENQVNYNINVEESFDIVINYDNFSYSIPVISEEGGISELLPLLPPPKDAIQFINEDVEINLRLDESPSDELEFINNWDYTLKDVRLNVTKGLRDILEFEQDYFESIDSGESIKTEIYLNKNKEPVYPHYEGYIVVQSSKGTSDSLEFSIDFEVEPYEGSEEEETEVSEEEENEETESETKSTAEKRRSLWWLWLIIILVIGVFGFLFFRKKKTVTEKFEDYAKKIKK